MQRLRVIDSHTEGEPTRLVFLEGLNLSSIDPVAVREELQTERDFIRTATVCEPRAYPAVIGALLLPGGDGYDAGVVFFNSVGYLGMCGHGTIGLVRTLQHLGMVNPGPVRLATPVGEVSAILHDDARVTITNVPSYRFRTNVSVDVPGHGVRVGDIAYGGNWFFLVKGERELRATDLDQLTQETVAILNALQEQHITGVGGGLIDHVEIFGPSDKGNSKSFVLCPGNTYDRSPCGTGTSAKLACLAADGLLAPGEIWRQESIIGSVFEASYEALREGKVRPSLTGRAFITAESELRFDPADPFRFGIS